MLRPEAIAASQAFRQEVERIALPIDVGTPASGNAFSTLMTDVRNDVESFIANGSGSLGSFSLSAEGGVQRAKLAAAVSSAPAAAPDEQRAFLGSVAPWAREVGDRLGVAPELVAAHAALESGWGREPLRHVDGSSTNNLFGIKAGGAWRGAAASAMTTEVVDGVALKETHEFRSYGDVASAFRDYAHVLLDNPRYGAALNTGTDARAFAEGLVRGRYATDPDYPSKLENVARRVRELSVDY